ncbi:hypothetical protein DL766_006462 [Monosporascus sp. MC13-8B]|uniref:Uncharacterized protein n=1 Tax=Monosporascus cannonballus TaxID=155416 RepID=A0ABY0H364_9PEZI|nr:hypothetical protein DL762_006058 [Monosporascus cannonballus]RYO84270.1 hypothetical protein DL763_007528 [Monosporascus cannonballus]RYP27250.1 hypothetical protein DL766_006462 [Monosporascus sp. MC13-8B]
MSSSEHVEHVGWDIPAPSAQDATSSLVPYEPSPEERDEYYYGFAGNPKLVARTSCDIWAKPQHEEGWDQKLCQTPKRYAAIGDHDIVRKWSKILCVQVAHALNNCHWNYFCPIRIGLKGNRFRDNCPVVLLIAVDWDTLSWKDGITTALQCRSILRNFQIGDVEVEIMEGRYRHAAVSTELEALFDPEDEVQENIHETMIPMLSSLGYPLGYLEDRRGQGTLGLYLKFKDHTPIYGLTCRHVVHGDRQAGDSYKFSGADRQQYHIQGTQATFQGWECELEAKLVQCKSLIERLEYKHNCWDSYLQYDETRQHLRPTDLERMQLDSVRVESAFTEKVLKCVSQLVQKDKRKVGHLAFHPALQVSARKPGYLKDWALVELDLAKYLGPPENKVFLGDRGLAEMKSHRFRPMVTKLVKGHLPLSGILPAEDTQAQVFLSGMPPEEYRQGTMVVGKRGARTGLTFGVKNEIEAVIRSPGCGLDDQLTWEMLIIPAEGYEKFSDGGDSGSSVFDLEGRVVGLVTGSTHEPRFKDGKRKKHPGDDTSPDTAEEGDATELSTEVDRTDITFASPIQWVLDDIEDFTGMKPQIV